MLPVCAIHSMIMNGNKNNQILQNSSQSAMEMLRNENHDFTPTNLIGKMELTKFFMNFIIKVKE